MKTIDLWLWVMTNDQGKRVKTRHRMSEADALSVDPDAQRVPGSLEQRLVPETDAEADGLRSSPRTGPPR